MVGSLLSFRNNPLKFLLGVSIKHPHVARYRLRKDEVWQISDPALAAEVLDAQGLTVTPTLGGMAVPTGLDVAPAEPVATVVERALALAKELRAGETRRFNADAEAVTGSEACGLALSWACYELSRHGGARQDCLEEVDRVLGARPVTADDLPHLHKIQGVVLEAMRLYPAVWALVRTADQDVPLDRYVIPAGAHVVVSPFALHQIPRWYSEPEDFVARRWEGGLLDRLPPGGYLTPDGADQCIAAIATLYQHLWLVEGPGQQIELQPSDLLRPRDPILLSVHLRHLQ